MTTIEVLHNGIVWLTGDFTFGTVEEGGMFVGSYADGTRTSTGLAPASHVPGRSFRVTA